MIEISNQKLSYTFTNENSLEHVPYCSFLVFRNFVKKHFLCDQISWPSLITTLSHTKSQKYYINNELNRYLRVICWSSHNFNILGHVIQCRNDVLISKRRGEWSREINSPNIKDLNFEDTAQRYFISFWYVFGTLT